MRACMIGASLGDVRKLFRHSVPHAKVSHRGPARGQGKTSVMVSFPTWKGQKRMEQLRHYWHASYAELLEADPDVLSWAADCAPVTDAGGAERSWTPAFKVRRRSCSSQLVFMASIEIIASTYRRDPNLRDACAAVGAELVVASRCEIEKHPALPVAQEVRRRRTWPLPDGIAHRMMMMVVDPPPTLGDLQERLGPDEPWETVLSLIGRGFVNIGLATEISERTPLVACYSSGVL